MNSKRNLYFALITLILVPSWTIAQSKICHINSQELVAEMPEMRAAKAKMDEMESNYKKQFEPVYQQFQAMVEKLNNLPAGTPEEEIAKQQKELFDFRQKIQEAEQSARKDLGQKQQELYEPLLNKAREAVIKVARSLGYEYVLDSSKGGYVIVASGKNLIREVEKELGIAPTGK